MNGSISLGKERNVSTLISRCLFKRIFYGRISPILWPSELQVTPTLARVRRTYQS